MEKNLNRPKRLPILTQRMGGSNAYLSPEPIYALNRLLHEIMEELVQNGKDYRPWAVPILFSKPTRSWHYACVENDSYWEGRQIGNRASPQEEDDFVIGATWFLWQIASIPSLFVQLITLSDFILDQPEYREAYDFVVRKVCALKNMIAEANETLPTPQVDADYISIINGEIDWGRIDKKLPEFIGKKHYNSICNVLAIGDPALRNEFLRKLLFFFFGIRNHRRNFLSGVMYHVLKDTPSGWVLDRLDIELKQGGEDKGAADYTSCYFGYGKNKSGEISQIRFSIPDSDAEATQSILDARRALTISYMATLPFYWRRLMGEQIQYATTNKNKSLPVTVLPIHDVWLGNVGYGGIWGCLILTFHEDKDRISFNEGDKGIDGKYEIPKLELLRSGSEAIAAELYASALVDVASMPIQAPYDLVEHFVRVLINVQDWERVTVYKGKELQYCYRHNLKKMEDGRWDYLGDYSWEKCSGEACGTFGKCPNENTGSKGTLTWCNDTPGCDIWSEELLPELTASDRDRFKDYVLEFEYSPTATIPQKDRSEDGKVDKTFELFQLAVVQQQLDVLRTIIPKVQARRAALRSAVSAIMGRNMSHNIGSHVIARYASKARNDRHETTRDEADHRGDFLAYLQRRMDFLAEVATSDKAFWSQPLSLREQVNRLNYAVQQKRFVVEEQLHNNGICPIDADCAHHLSPKAKQDQAADDMEPQRPILLSFITGKASLLASVEYGKPGELCAPGEAEPPADCCRGHKTEPPTNAHVFFACPGGEVGAHALYVILENVIRNSARHGGDSGDTVRVFVNVVDDPVDNDYLQVELIDPRTKLTKNGCLFSRKENDSEAIAQNRELAERRINSLHDINGKRIRLHSVPKNINSILCDEPFLDDVGAPNPNYWGVREMQICAHYLRNTELSDLEGVQPPGAPVLEADVYPLDMDKSEWCLMYRFRLQRPKLLAVVVRDAECYKGQANSLRSKGVIVRPAPKPEDRAGWYELSGEVQNYGVLVIEDGVEFPKEDEFSRVALPVRTFFSMKGKELAALISSAQLNSPSIWMEKLHNRVAKQYQDKRGRPWADKTLFGLVLGRDKLEQGCLPVDPPTNGGLFWAKGLTGRVDRANPVGPLPEELEKWHRSLSDGSKIAAIWVDHPGKLDFDSPWAKLAHASKKPPNGDDGPMWISAEGAFSDSLHVAYLNEICSQGNSSAGHELLAAALPRVVVLDERVQSELNRDARSGLPLSNMWPLMGVWVPERPKDAATEDASPPACDLDTPSLEAIQKFLKKPARRSDQYPVDFLVIHLTILERLKENCRLSLPEVLKQLKAGTWAVDAEVIIVTGRGVPSMARKLNDEHLEMARFLPISALLECLVLRPSKLALMRVLWSAGRPRNNGDS